MAEPNANQPQSVDVNELQKQVAALQKTVGDIQPFVEDASYLVAAIYQDPQLKQTVQERLKSGPQNPQQPGQQQPGQQTTQQQQPVGQQTPPNQTPGQQPNTQNPNVRYDPVTGQPIQSPQNPPQNQTPPSMNRSNVPQSNLTDMDIKMREDIINQVEAKYGYDKMDKEQRKELRKTVEKRLNAWNTSVLSAPMNELGRVLEDAYMLADMKTAKDDGRLQGLIEARTNDQAVFPTMGSQQPAQDTTGELSPDQREWSKKMGLDESKVGERLKEFQETGVMTYKPKEQQQQNNQPAPSGTPTPPAQNQPQNQPQS